MSTNSGQVLRTIKRLFRWATVVTLSVLPVGLATLPVAACVHFGMVRLALSHVGVENSREILAVETADTSFDASVTAAEARWEEVFSRIDVEGVSDAERRVWNPDTHHVSRWIERVQEVDSDAAALLWQHLLNRLVRSVRLWLPVLGAVGLADVVLERNSLLPSLVVGMPGVLIFYPLFRRAFSPRRPSAEHWRTRLAGTSIATAFSALNEIEQAQIQ